MNPIAQELFETGDRYLVERPDDIVAMRSRMGTRGQNMTVQIYAFQRPEQFCRRDVPPAGGRCQGRVRLRHGREVRPSTGSPRSRRPPMTARRMPSSGTARPSITGWTTSLISSRGPAPRSSGPAPARRCVNSSRHWEHYLNQVRTWIDLEFPWHELAVRYAEIMGDPVPRPAP